MFNRRLTHATITYNRSKEIKKLDGVLINYYKKYYFN